MRLEFSAQAARDYDAIVDHSVTKFGAEIAAQYQQALEGVFERLFRFPKSGRNEPNLLHNIRSMSCESHRIYYSVFDDRIFIQRILHKSMDASNWLG